MHYVYFIKSKAFDFHYVGMTNDLRKRFAEHNARTELSTKAYAPFKLIYYEAYANRKDAVIREKKLKQYGSSIGHLKRRLKNSLIE